MPRRSRRRRPSKASAGLTLEMQIRAALPPSIAAMYVREYKFHPTRLWRFDHCLPPLKIAIEQEGGLFQGWRSKRALANLAALGQKLRPADVGMIEAVAGGRHSQPATMRADMEKYNEAAVLGWIVLRVTPEMIEDGRALTWLEGAISLTSTRAAWKGL